MKKLILIGIVFTSLTAWAGTGDRFPEDRMDDAQTEMVKQRMETIQKEEERPSSTAVGGSRSGQLEFEKRSDKENYDIEKQKQLFEYDDQYRRGL